MKMRSSMKWALLLAVLIVGCTPEFPQEKSYAGKAFAAVAQQNVPAWAKANNAPWASPPKDISLDGNFNSNRQLVQGSDLDLKVDNFNLVWSEGYQIDTEYVLTQLKIDPSGKTIDPSKIWVNFKFKNAQGTFVSIPSWIVAGTGSTVATARLNASKFRSRQDQVGVSSEELNSVLVFACNRGATLSSGSVVYDCNGADGKSVVVRTDGSLETISGRGSWMLVSIDVVGTLSGSTSTVPSFQPGGLGSTSPTSTGSTSTVPPFQPGGLGSTNPTTTTTTTTTTSTTTSATSSTAPGGIVPVLIGAPPPFCISPNNPSGCI